eukprot:TRINITY_DN1805_c0_g5_i4.p1 TRINITY_DN1805_c0_g5~~TRINITY_DN1805_c0_g5_i4.p1  ORF type:complete len:245 (+),score=71.64 TRINITY_DN1805_c0_g5_i4:65-799(+)
MCIRDRYMGNRRLVYRAVSVNLDDSNHAIINYYQTGVRNFTVFACLQMMKPLLSEKSFAYLRTQKQLGYIVSSGIFSYNLIDGAFVLIEGSAAPPDQMNKDIEDFLTVFQTKLENLDEKELQHMKDAVIQTIEQNGKSNEQRTERYWSDILQGEINVGTIDALKAKVPTITKQTLLQVYRQVFQQDVRKLSIQVFSQKYYISNMKSLSDSLLPREILLTDFQQLNMLKRFPPYSEYIGDVSASL